MWTRNEHVRSLAVLGGAALLFAVAVWWPLHASVGRAQAKLAEARAALDAGHAAVAETADLTAKLRTINERRAALAAGVPGQPDLADCLGQLGADLKHVSAINPQIKTLPVTDAGVAQVIPFSIEFQSTSSAAFDFVRRVEQAGRIMHVNQLRITRTIDESRIPVRVTMELSTFCRPQDGGSL